MKIQMMTATAATLALAFPQVAAAAGDGITWVPQIGFQYKQLEFKQDFTGPVTDNGSVEADLPSVSLSLTALYNKFYVAVKYEDSLGDPSGYSDVTFTNSETNVDREDLSVTFGYNVWGNGNIFVGYMVGETTLKPTPICPSQDYYQGPPPAEHDCTSSWLFGGDGNFAFDAFLNGDPDYKQSYKEDGVYLGGSYGWKVAQMGTLSVSLAYAKLDTVYKDNFTHGDSLVPGKFTGDADGFSLGLNWSAPLTSRVGYYLDVRTQQYKMDSKDATGYWSGVAVETEENILAFTAGIQWYL
jgi:hypothetical protein